jgi:hypothetical protein
MAPYVHTDGRTLQLGKQPAKIDKRTLKLANYAPLPLPPIACDFTKGVTEFGMMLNGPNSYGGKVPADGLGDCTCAMMGHGSQIARLNSPTGLITPPDLFILGLYIASCGYIPGDANTDQGGVIVDVLNWARKNSPWMKKHRPSGSGHKHPFQLLAYADPDPSNLVHVQQAIATFGTVGMGVQLPITAQAQVGTLWDVVGNPNSDPNSAPGSWGGHAVIVCGYKYVNGVLWLLCITWGQLQWMTANFWLTYVDEAHALLYLAWVENFGQNFSAMLTEMVADLKLVTG